MHISPATNVLNILMDVELSIYDFVIHSGRRQSPSLSFRGRLDLCSVNLRRGSLNDPHNNNGAARKGSPDRSRRSRNGTHNKGASGMVCCDAEMTGFRM